MAPKVAPPPKATRARSGSTEFHMSGGLRSRGPGPAVGAGRAHSHTLATHHQQAGHITALGSRGRGVAGSRARRGSVGSVRGAASAAR